MNPTLKMRKITLNRQMNHLSKAVLLSQAYRKMKNKTSNHNRVKTKKRTQSVRENRGNRIFLIITCDSNN
jgi:hypothetical protein